MSDEIHYKEFVDYDALDPFTRLAMDKFSSTTGNANKHGVKLLEESLGETAQVFRVEGVNHYLAQNAEILGTKVAIAIEMSRRDWVHRERYFRGIGQDTANMSFNDLAGVGARPKGYQLIICMGDNDFVKDPAINNALLDGFLTAANENGAIIPGGETGTVKGIVVSGQADLAGASWGIIDPKERFCYGGKVEPGTILYGISTEGPNANGISSIRRIADTTKYGYFRELPSGKTFGEAVLKPTPSYAPIVNEMMDKGVPVIYLQPITGHGFKKIARPRKDLTYRLTDLLPRPEVFHYIKQKTRISDKEMVETYNCGLGFVVYTKREDDRIEEISQAHGQRAEKIGVVETGPRRVIIEPLEVEFTSEDLSK